MSKCFLSNSIRPSISNISSCKLNRCIARRCLCCRPCIPTCPPCPSCPTCPPCPTPSFPNVVCVPAFESFADQLLQTPAISVNIPNAFNSNDGPAPYQLVSTGFMNLQMPLMNPTFTPLGGSNYSFTANITPMVIVEYLDGNNILRSKLVQAPMPLSTTITTSVNPNGVVWLAFMESGSISNAQLSGTTLSFTAMTTIKLIAIPPNPLNYPVLQDFTCLDQAPVEAICQNIYQLASYCQISTVVLGESDIVIPYAPLGPAPYSNPSVIPLGGLPYVIRIAPQPGNMTLIDLAFPVTLSFADANNIIHTQSSFLYLPLLTSGVASDSNVRAIVDLEISTIQLSTGPITTPVIFPSRLVLFGTIAVIENLNDVLVTNAVQCGGVVISTCMVPVRPPTIQ